MLNKTMSDTSIFVFSACFGENVEKEGLIVYFG